jgi:hypothetical protein
MVIRKTVIEAPGTRVRRYAIMVRIWLSLSLVVVLLAGVAFTVHAQQSSQNTPSPDRWLSHQMNQPAPDFGERNLSQERLNELRELYELAKREAEAKSGKKSSDKK